MRRILEGLLLLPVLCCPVVASTLTVGGAITQSTADGTGPAVQNASLNTIEDGQAFAVTIVSAKPIDAPGFYDLAGSPVIFSVPSAGASETSFAATSLSVTADGGYLNFSLYACVADADCSIGNALSASFRILAGDLGGSGVEATGLDEPHPFEFLEDDGVTDLHGAITTYSNTALVTTPELPSGVLTMTAVLGAAVTRLRRSKSVFSRRKS